MKKLYIEDCLETLKRDLTYDYVVTSPPDFDELDKAIDFSYEDFIKQFAVLLNPIGNFVSICISDRKSGGQIISKHSIVIDVFKTLGYILHSHKIWVKGTGVNDYRVNYQHIMTFSRKGTKRKPVRGDNRCPQTSCPPCDPSALFCEGLEHILKKGSEHFL